MVLSRALSASNSRGRAIRKQSSMLWTAWSRISESRTAWLLAQRFSRPLSFVPPSARSADLPALLAPTSLANRAKSAQNGGPRPIEPNRPTGAFACLDRLCGDEIADALEKGDCGPVGRLGPNHGRYGNRNEHLAPLGHRSFNQRDHRHRLADIDDELIKVGPSRWSGQSQTELVGSSSEVTRLLKTLVPSPNYPVLQADLD